MGCKGKRKKFISRASIDDVEVDVLRSTRRLGRNRGPRGVRVLRNKRLKGGPCRFIPVIPQTDPSQR